MIVNCKVSDCTGELITNCSKCHNGLLCNTCGKCSKCESDSSEDIEHKALRGMIVVVRDEDPYSCLLCESSHRPIYRLDEKVDLLHGSEKKLGDALKVKGEISLNTLKLVQLDKCSDGTLTAIYTLLGSETKNKVLCQIGEHSARIMLTHGAEWYKSNQNLRVQGKTDSSLPITLQPCMSLQTVRQCKNVWDLSIEKFVHEFHKFLRSDEKQTYAALCALQETSKDNLEALAGELGYKSVKKALEDDLVAHLMDFHLTLTHYAASARGYSCANGKRKILTLFSRHLLDREAKTLGIKNYSSENTPNSALKNVGHHDYIFCAIEPRDGKPLSAPFKKSSRFGEYCHAFDLDGISEYAVLTFGDLDTKNAKIGINRLKSKVKDIENRLQYDKSLAKQHIKQLGEEVFVRKMEKSSQILIKGHVKLGLALKVAYCLQKLHFSREECLELIKTAADYNIFLNGLFVPQMMIPHCLVTDQYVVFTGDT